jgi:phosphopantetheinyl transferase
LLHALPYAKRLEFERRDEPDLRASLGGLALLVLGAGRANPVLQRLTFAPDRKPHCDGGPFFSISHGDGHVACAISERLDLGIDIERLDARATSEDCEKLRRWTATEACLKAAGLGLRHADQVLVDIDFAGATIGPQRFALQQVNVADGYVCHLATAAAACAPGIMAVRLDDAATSTEIERCLGLATQVE